ncbi:unnamed protein product [Chrysoparadoxa australica]
MTAVDPTGWDTSWGCSSHIQVTLDKLGAKYKGKANHDADAGCVRSDHPVPPKQGTYYFEVTILDRGESGNISVGLVDHQSKLKRRPGFQPGSYGYSGTDGRIHRGSVRGRAYGPSFQSGDTAGCGVTLSKGEVFFTHNGNFLGVAIKNVTGPLYPCIGLHGPGEKLRANFGREPFEFRLEGLLEQEASLEREAVARVPICPTVTKELVMDFLLRQGHVKTLEGMALDESRGRGNGGCWSVAGQANCEAEEQPGCIRAGKIRRLQHGQCPLHVQALLDSSRQLKDPMEASLVQRAQVRDAAASGNVGLATRVLEASFPGLLEESGDTRFVLHSREFVHLLRTGDIAAALTLAREQLAPFHSKLGWSAASCDAKRKGPEGGGDDSKPGEAETPQAAMTENGAAAAGSMPSDQRLQEMMGLLLKTPEQLHASPLASSSHDQRMTDLLNDAMCGYACSKQGQSFNNFDQQVSALEKLCRHLEAMQQLSSDLCASGS